MKQLLYPTPAIYLEDQGTELPFPTSFPSLIGITFISLRSRAEHLPALFLLLKFQSHFGGEDCQLHSVLSSLSKDRVLLLALNCSLWSFRGARELGSWTGPSKLRCPFRISCTWRGEVGPNFGLWRRQLRISLRCRNSQPTPTLTPLGPPPSGLGSSHSPRCQGPPSHLPDAHPASRARPREKEAEIVPTPAGRRLLPAARFNPVVCAYPACTSRP